LNWTPLASTSQGLLLPETCLVNTELQCGVSLIAGKSEKNVVVVIHGSGNGKF